MKANLAAQLLPAAAVGTKVFVMNDDYEVRIPHGDVDAMHDRLVCQGHLGLADLRNTHAGRNLKMIPLRADDPARALAGICFQRDHIA